MIDNKEVLWKNKTLGDVSIITLGQSPSSSSYNENGIGSYLIQGNADIKNRKSLPRQWTSEPTKFCDVGDTLMTVRAPVGAVAKSMHLACIGRGVCSIKPKHIDHEFLYQFLLSYESKWKALEQGSTFTAVNGTDIKGVQLQLPPLLEQQKIADILSTVDAKIEIISQQITETQELKKGLMQRLLTKGIGHTEFKDSSLGEIPKSWKVVRFGDTLSQSPEYGANASAKEFNKEGYRYIRITDILENGKLTQNNFVGISISEGEQYELKQNDILIARTGNTVGKSFLYDVNDGLCSFAGYLIRFKPNDTILNPKYIIQYLHSEMFWKWINTTVRTGAQPNVNSKEYQSMSFPLPSLVEQQKISEILNSLDEKLDLLSEKKTTYQELKQGLMQQLLTGKVRVEV